MPNYCPECGQSLPSIKVKYCTDCGYDLRIILDKEEQPIEKVEEIEKEIEEEEQEEIEEEVSIKGDRISIFELGERLEQVVEQIFQARGYLTQRRQRLKGKSGTINEIDVLAKKGSKVIAVECKNLSMPVGQSLIRDFHGKLVELNILKGYFASNSELTKGASQYAEQHNITVWSQDNLKEKYWLISTGRGISNIKRKIKNALPINVSYNDVTELELENKNVIEIVENNLYFHPYYVLEYSFKVNYHDPSRELHKFHDEGVVFIDALDGRILNDISLKTKISQLFSQEGAETKILNECQNYKFNETYDVRADPFEIIIMEPQIQNRFSKKLAIDFITEKNTQKISYIPKSSNSIFNTKIVTYKPKRKDISIKKITFFNIPKWGITFSSGSIDYTREIFAYSGEKLEDTIQYCPKHYSIGSMQLFSKNNVAVCEVCGQALCSEHISNCPTCGKWLCHEDGLMCGSCNRIYCGYHIDEKCSICEMHLCQDCISICTVCGEIFGNKHEIECENCGRTLCPNCVTSKGLIRKKYFCKDCV